MGILEDQPGPEPEGHVEFHEVPLMVELGALAKLSSSPILQIETLRPRAGKDSPKVPQ